MIKVLKSNSLPLTDEFVRDEFLLVRLDWLSLKGHDSYEGEGHCPVPHGFLSKL